MNFTSKNEKFEELHNLYCVPNVIRAVKSGRMRHTGHLMFMADLRKADIVVGNLNVSDH
jgi:hypothetical protein